MNVERTDEQLTDWFRSHLGAEVVGIRQQARWRPVWFVDVVRDGETSTVPQLVDPTVPAAEPIPGNASYTG